MRSLLRVLLVALAITAVTAPAHAGTPARATVAKRPAARPAQARKRAVVFVGMPGAGKTHVSQKLAEKMGLEKPLISGDIVREAVGPTKNDAERGRRVLEVSKEFAKKKGEIGRRVALKARKVQHDLVIVEGFRTPDDLRAFRKAFPDTVVVSLEVPAQLRHERMLLRGRAGEDNQAYLDKRDKQELSVGLGKLMQGADIKVQVRSNSPAELDRVLDSIRTQVSSGQ